MSQLGIPHYRDLLNKYKLHKLKDEVNMLALSCARLCASDAVENRENEEFPVYMKQYNMDMTNLREIVKNAQRVVNECNEIQYLIVNEAVSHHIYNFGDEEIEEPENPEDPGHDSYDESEESEE